MTRYYNETLLSIFYQNIFGVLFLFFREGTEEARKEILIKQRAQLQEQYDQLKTIMERLDYKIAHYEEIMAKNCPSLKS